MIAVERIGSRRGAALNEWTGLLERSPSDYMNPKVRGVGKSVPEGVHREKS